MAAAAVAATTTATATVTEFSEKWERSLKWEPSVIYLQNHVVYQRTEMILRNPLTSPVRGANQNGHAPSRAFGWAQKAIYAGSIVISLDAVYQGDAEDFQPERQLIRRLLYSPTGLSFFFFGVVHNWFAS